MKNKNLNRRKKLILNHSIENDMFKYVFGLAVFIALGQGAVAYIVLGQLSNVESDLISPMMLKQQLQALMIYQIMPIISSTLVGYYIFSRFTNRIVGPVYHILRVVKAVNEKEQGPHEIHLRKDDHLRDLAAEINKLLKSKQGS